MEKEIIIAEVNRVLDEAVEALSTAGHLERGSVIVLGCSTSEIVGARIGKGSVPELGEIVADAMLTACRNRGLHPAFQCCEHLNRAIVLEKDVLTALRLTQVNAVPQPKAGGSVPAAAWKRLNRPALAMSIQADAVIDIGDTLVGMHIRPVAVPLRISTNRIGDANLVMAYARLPYIGGERAVYSDVETDLLAQCVEMVVRDGQITLPIIQRRLKLGYVRAGRLIDEMQRRGIISSWDGVNPYRCLITPEQYEAMKANGEI